MRLLLEWTQKSLILEPDSSYFLGRDDSSDICIPDSKVSRKHLRFFFKEGKWIVQDLNSSNGSFANNTKFNEIIISKEITLFIGDKQSNEVKVSVVDKKTVKKQQIDETRQILAVDDFEFAPEDFSGRIRLKKKLRIGRDISNDWVIQSPNASRVHAEVIQNGNTFELVDLKSTNGTYVNGDKISRSVLKPGDKITIAGISRVFTFNGLEPESGISGTSIQLENLSFNIGEKKLIDKVNLNFGASTLTAIIGPSGAGKSTLLSLLAGRSKPSEGSIKIGSYDLEKHYELVTKDCIALIGTSNLEPTFILISLFILISNLISFQR